MDEKPLGCKSKSELTGEQIERCFGLDRKRRSLRRNAKVVGRMECPSGYGKVKGTCGKSLEIYLKIQRHVIEGVTFYTEDRTATRECGSAVAELCTGLTLDEAALIGGDTILDLLGGLPKGKVHCAFLAAEALHAALGDWRKRLGYADR